MSDDDLLPAEDRLKEAGFYTLGDDPGPEAVRAVCRRLPEMLTGTDALDRVTVREAAIEALKDAGVVGARDRVDAALAPDGSDAGDDLQGDRIAFEDPEPWPDPVDGAALLDDVEATARRFLVLPKGGYAAFALWTVHAHAHEAAEISPILSFVSAVRGCGKTTGLTLLHALAPRGLFASSLTAATLFRTVEQHRPTLLIDEADTFLGRREDLRGVLNSGHFRAGAVVVRSVGDDHEPRAFSTWAPKALAKIGQLPSTLSDRSLVIRMRRVTPEEDERLESVRLDRIHDELRPLQRKATRWADDHLEALTAADPDVPDDLRDRDADNARPLLAVADRAGGGWPRKARKALRRLADRDVDREEAGILLLADLRDLFEAREAEKLPSKEIAATLGQREDRPWSEWKDSTEITTRQLAKLLRPFDVKPKPLWIDGKTLRGYTRDDLRDPIRRYVGVETRNVRNEDGEHTGSDDSETRNVDENITGSESPGRGDSTGDITGVTGSGGESRGKGDGPATREQLDRIRNALDELPDHVADDVRTTLSGGLDRTAAADLIAELEGQL